MQDYESFRLEDFAGPTTRGDTTDVPPTGALLALNCEWNPGAVQTRKGFKSVWNPAETITSMANWVFGSANYLIYFSTASGGKVRYVTDLSSPSPADLYTQSAASAVIAVAGPRVYIAQYNSAGAGVGDAHAVNQAGTADRCFLGPISTKPSLSNTGSGGVTPGIHLVGYIIQTRSGFFGTISPQTSSINQYGTYFDASSGIVALGGQQIGFSITATWPAEAAFIYPVMTPTSNLARFFLVPGLVAAVPGGSSSTVAFNLNIDDSSMLALAATNEVTNNLNFLTRSLAGAVPFSPFSVGDYGFRNWYLTDISGQSQCYMSDQNNPQQLAADLNVLYLPGFQQMRAAFSLGGVWWCLGPHWTYGFRDNGDSPVTWPAPEKVDAAVGAPGPHCVCVNASQGFAFVAHETGAWVFSGGTYAARPLSYYVDPDWKRINWVGGGFNVRVVDHKDRQRCYIFAPLDSATANSHIFMIDYANGLAPEQVKISLWDLSNAGFASLTAGAIVQNPTTDNLDLWIGTTSKVLRQMLATEANPYADDSLGIDWQYETAPLPGLNGTIFYHYLWQARLSGSGTVTGTTYGIDRTVSSAWTQAITATPGKMFTKRYTRVRSESASLRFTNGKVANSYAILSSFEHYYGPGPAFR